MALVFSAGNIQGQNKSKTNKGKATKPVKQEPATTASLPSN